MCCQSKLYGSLNNGIRILKCEYQTLKELISLSKVNLVRSTLGFERQSQQWNCVRPGKLWHL